MTHGYDIGQCCSSHFSLGGTRGQEHGVEARRQRPVWTIVCLFLALTVDIEVAVNSDLVSLGLKFLLPVMEIVSSCHTPLRRLGGRLNKILYV